FNAPAAVDKTWPDDRGVGVPLEHIEESIHGVGRNDSVAVQEQDVRAGAGADAEIGRTGEAEIAARVDHADACYRAGSIGATVARLVVDDDDFVRPRRRRDAQRVDAAEEIDACVVADDDDREIDMHSVRGVQLLDRRSLGRRRFSRTYTWWT